MSIYMSENEFRDFLRRFLNVEHHPHGVAININTSDAERFLAKHKTNARLIMNNAIEFIGQIAEKVVTEIKQDLKAGKPFPYPIKDYR